MQTKDTLATMIAEKNQISKVAASHIVNDIFDAIVDETVKGERVIIHNFGTFSAVVRKERSGRNPQTGKKIKIAAKTVPHFKAGAGFKSALIK